MVTIYALSDKLRHNMQYTSGGISCTTAKIDKIKHQNLALNFLISISSPRLHLLSANIHHSFTTERNVYVQQQILLQQHLYRHPQYGSARKLLHLTKGQIIISE